MNEEYGDTVYKQAIIQISSTPFWQTNDNIHTIISLLCTCGSNACESNLFADCGKYLQFEVRHKMEPELVRWIRDFKHTYTNTWCCIADSLFTLWYVSRSRVFGKQIIILSRFSLVFVEPVEKEGKKTRKPVQKPLAVTATDSLADNKKALQAVLLK